MNRRFTFSNPQIIKRLQTEFVPVSGDCSEFQFGHNKTSNWFMQAVAHTQNNDLAHQLRTDNTVQGLFVMGADGSSYGWMNDNSPQNVNAFLDRCLLSFNRQPPSPVDISPFDTLEIWSKRPPAGATVVRVFSRIRPLPAHSGCLNESVGRDHMWIYQREIAEIIASSDADHHQSIHSNSDSDSDSHFHFPDTLAARMVRFHLLDNVRGEPDMFDASEVTQADFTCTGVKNNGDLRTVQFKGEFEQQGKKRPRGVKGTIFGEMTLNTKAQTLTHFRAYADAHAWGTSTYTPDAPAGSFPLVIAMVDVNDDVAEVVPPEAVMYDYETPALTLWSTRRASKD